MIKWASQVVPVVKYPVANAVDIGDMGSILGSERSPGGRHGISLQYSCLENPMARGATVYMVIKESNKTKATAHTAIIKPIIVSCVVSYQYCAHIVSWLLKANKTI